MQCSLMHRWRNLWSASSGYISSFFSEDADSKYVSSKVHSVTSKKISHICCCKKVMSLIVNCVVLCSKLDIRVVKRRRPESRGRRPLENSVPLSSEPSIQEDTFVSQLSTSFRSLLSNIGASNKRHKQSFLTSTRVYESSDWPAVHHQLAWLGEFVNVHTGQYALYVQDQYNQTLWGYARMHSDICWLRPGNVSSVHNDVFCKKVLHVSQSFGFLGY